VISSLLQADDDGGANEKDNENANVFDNLMACIVSASVDQETYQNTVYF